MIAGRNRFQGHNSVQNVYRHRRGTTLRGAMINLKVAPLSTRPDDLPNPKEPQTTGYPLYKAAVVVSKKVHKSAVVRNRIRRRIYEIVRTYPDLGPDANAASGLQLVFVVYSEQLATISSLKLRASVHDLLARAIAAHVGSTTTQPSSPNTGGRAIVEPNKEP